MTVFPPASPQARALAHVAARAAGEALDASLPITVHFHPDRLVAGRSILQAMAHDGVYRSQFETGTSNGGLTAHPGGDRWRWESRIFGGAYDLSPPSERPKYGSLNVHRRAHGGSPRFGSAHLRLRGEILSRTTFCHPDSVFEPTCFGVAARGSAVIAQAMATEADALDDYVEAQIHGEVRFSRDVDAIVLDPCYRDTAVEREARALGCVVAWHPGFCLHTDVLRLHGDYRGPEVVALGLALADDGALTPRTLGLAAATGRHDPQSLKRLWHCVARFGLREL
ncbi:DUF3626 domain-containing protein [uncultured Alsobacter sp.]|uniref:DUF3626 domain-containing protein n=1 Tax=uncultured Alsobacter sp. TaxID=1748258 RepID=UPI0025D50B90|nr:DUF3626 domain-containing protein [uncultured Alsobacter sp.]